MIYCWNDIHKPPRGPIAKAPQFAQIFDANGLKYEYVLWCDTETGEIAYYERGEKNIFKQNPITYEPIVTLVTAAAPLTVIDVLARVRERVAAR